MILNNLTFSGADGAVVNELGFSLRNEGIPSRYVTTGPLAPAMLTEFRDGNYFGAVQKLDPGRMELYFSFDNYFEPISADWTRNTKGFMFYETGSNFQQLLYYGFNGRLGELIVETTAGTLYSGNFTPVTLEQIANKVVKFKICIRLAPVATDPGYIKIVVNIDGVDITAIDGNVMIGPRDLGDQWYGCYCTTDTETFQPASTRIRFSNLVIATTEAEIFTPPVEATVAIPVSTALTTNRICLATDYLRRLQGMKNNCSAWNGVLAGTVTYDQIIVIAKQLASQRAAFTSYLTPGVRTYLTAELGMDVTDDMQAIGTQIANIISWTRTTVPVDSNGYLLERQLDANGNVTTSTLTTAQTATCRTALNNIIALIG